MEQEVGFRSNLSYEEKAGYGRVYASAKGLLIGTRARLLGENGGEIVTAIYYDDKGRIIQKKSTNHLNGLDKEYYAYTFTGQTLKKLTEHTAGNQAPLTELYTYTYDHAGRLIDTKHQLNNQAEKLLSKNEYDELGRVKKSTANNDRYRTTNYKYNIRGWVTEIDGVFFSEYLKYQDGPNPRYNGNISYMKWYSNEDDMFRRYHYTYDGLNRLTNADYFEVGGYYDSPSDRGGDYSTNYQYDKNGNMLHLQRSGMISYYNLGATDNLSYTYNGNQVSSITDDAARAIYYGTEDFHDNNTTSNDFLYNANGYVNQDLNKGIKNITYNYLNLPEKLTFGGGNTLTYVYDALGVKRRMVIGTNIDDQYSPLSQTTESEESEFDYELSPIDYLNNYVYRDNVLERILLPNGHIYHQGNRYDYNYYIKDHLGSIRVMSDEYYNDKCNHYYPFGSMFGISCENDHPYKYNGKEQQKDHRLNWYDYGARMYSATEGIWKGPDPLAEKYYSISPYVYCKNNPVNRIDLDGRDDYYSMDGRFLSRDDKETDNIIIRQDNYYKKMLKSSSIPGLDLSNLPDHFDTPLTDMTLSAEAYSNIFTDVLSRSGFDVGTLQNGHISVKVLDNSDWYIVDQYNSPSKVDSHASTTLDGTKITATVRSGEDKELYGTFSNIQNMLGDHEFTGHKVKGWGNATQTHYKVYEYQKEQPSWQKATPYYRNTIDKIFEPYLNSRR